MSRTKKGRSLSLEYLQEQMGRSHHNDLRSPGTPTAADQFAETVEERVYRLKLEGYSPRDISTHTGKSPEEVEEITIQMAERSRQRLLAELSVGTIMEVDRLDTMHKALWPQASAGEGHAVDRVMGISRERRKLLGLDAPTGIGNSANELDLSVLNDKELLEYERIQRKLLDFKKKKALPAKSKRTSQPDIIDVEVEPPPGG